VVGQRKFGGNAQAISRDRWLHHTSLLWDFDPQRMGLLRQPSKAPDYRSGRAHEEFVMRLREVCGSREGLVQALCEGLQHQGFRVQEAALEEAEAAAAAAAGGLRGTRLLGEEEYLPGAAAAAAAV
jgi:lipoate-protein ligase A